MGSSNYITNFTGQVSQHMEYFAFGETFIEEHTDSHNSPYKFNGKELDEESDYTYYGARYLDMRYSIWISTDPLSGYNPIFEKEHYIDGQHNGGVLNYFNHHTYGYCYQNPVIYIDPNGKQTKVTGKDFDNLYDNYENGEEILNKEKGLNYLAGKNTNTCAIRLSNACNKAGYPIPKKCRNSIKC